MNEDFLKNPNLPDNKVTCVIISEKYPYLIQTLKQKSIHVISVPSSNNLASPVSSHADMVCLHMGEANVMVAFGESDFLIKELRQEGFNVFFTKQMLSSTYPNDVLVNVLMTNSSIIGNLNLIDNNLQKYISKRDFFKISVKQGYAKCSVALVNSKCLITADNGIANAAKDYGLEVLQIQKGHIQLDGYPYGFIGGCCGYINKNELAFTGSLKFHPDGKRIKSFLSFHGVNAIELYDGPLIDIGGILPVKERIG